MYLTTEKKAELFEKYGKDAKNTAGGKQSLKAYIWSLEMAAFDGQP